MDELGFDRETIAKVSRVPQRTVSDIANWKGCWASTGEFNELRETYRFYLRRYIRNEVVALGHTVLKRFEELVKDADFMTTLNIANAVMTLASKLKMENREMNKGEDRDIEHYLSTSGLMDVLEISWSTVYRLMAKGLPNIMVGSVQRFPIEHVFTWLKANYSDTTRS
jgi:hypothetical protein